MRKTIIILSLLILLILSLTCSSPQKINNEYYSRLLKFEDIGYGDTIYAILRGKIFEQKDSNMIPLTEVKFTVTPNPFPESNKILLKEHLKEDNSNIQLDSAIFDNDSTGFFSLPFCHGKFDILISKSGYQSVKLIYFKGDPDLFSYTEILMVKDTGMTVWDVSRGW